MIFFICLNIFINLGYVVHLRPWDAGQMMQDWRDAGLEGYRTGGIQEMWDTGKEGSGHEGCGTGKMLYTGQEGYRTGGMQDRWDAGQVGCRTGGMLDWRDAGLEGFRKGGIQERRDAGHVGCKTGVMQDRCDAGK